MPDPEPTSPPILFDLRSPSYDSAELVLTVDDLKKYTKDGRTFIFPLSFFQTRLFNSRTAHAIAHWPVREAPLE